MGEVYAAFDQKLEREVALKVLNSDDGDLAVQKKRLLREARLAAKLTHPNIATVFEVDELDGHLYIVMELLEGSSLRKLLMQRKMGIDEAISIARDIARALSRAHASGVIHRDIKPENIFITSPSPDAILAKVLDFGLARQRPLGDGNEYTMTNTTSRGDMWGTPGYVSPEQAHGQKVDIRTDIFSFGVIFYEMLAGIKPFRGADAIATMIATTRQEPRPLREITPEVHPDLEEIVAICLRKERETRYADGRELSAALEGFVRGSTNMHRVSNVVGSNPNLPVIATEDLATEVHTSVQFEDQSRTTGAATIAMTTLPPPDEVPPSLDQQRRDHMKLVAAIGSGVALALVVVIVALAWATSTPRAHAKTASSRVPAPSAVDPGPAPPPALATAAPSPSPTASVALELPPEGEDQPSPAPLPVAPESTATSSSPSPHAAAPAHAPVAAGSVRPAAGRKKPTDCAEPFRVDAKGVKIPKLHCL
jgi:serine/threonine protein kinase